MTRAAMLLTVAFAWLVSAAEAAAPSLGSITPYGGQRGTEVEVFFNGGRLSDAKDVMFYYPGITLTSLEVVNDGQVKTKLAIAPDCRLGIHAMRLRSASGISELRTFMVGAMPEGRWRNERRDALREAGCYTILLSVLELRAVLQQESEEVRA